MIEIRPDQFDAFARLRQNEAIEALTNTVAIAYPEIAWVYGWAEGSDGLRLLVQRYVEEGQAWGLTNEYTLGRYTYYRIDCGNDLLTEPEWEWLRDILSYQTVPEEEKIGQIDTILHGAPMYPETWDYE